MKFVLVLGIWIGEDYKLVILLGGVLLLEYCGNCMGSE